MLELAAHCQCRECREIEQLDRAVFQAFRISEAIQALELARTRWLDAKVVRFPIERTRSGGAL